MRLKSFYASTMTEAMQMIREALGDEAIIVATRDEAGGRVRVTAAIEQHDSSDFTTPLPSSMRTPIPTRHHGVPDDYLQYDTEEDIEEVVQEIITESLLKHGVPSDISDTILSTATMLGHDNANDSLNASLGHVFNFHPLPLKSPRKAIMLIGAAGAGKTLITAKLAARATLSGLKATVITTDTVRAGGVEQLEAFTRLLQIPLQKARNSKELSAQLQLSSGSDLTLIDTGGANPFDVDDMQSLARLIEAGSIEPVLVMAAGGDPEESAEMARCFGVLGAQRLIPTRLDVARRVGGLISAASRASLSFADGSSTPMVAGGIAPMTSQLLTSLILTDARPVKTAEQPQQLPRTTIRQTG